MFPGTRSFRPVDMLVEGRLDPAVYAYEVEDGWTQLILCNNHKEAATISAPISGDMADAGSLGLDADASYYLYDFWNDKFLGEIEGSDSVLQELKPEQALVYSLREKKDHPQVLSTNRHAMQGMVDLSAVSWDADKKVLSGTARVVGGEPFVITIANNDHQVDTASSSHESTDGGLTRLTMASGENAEVKWSVSWK
jgi:hypothetical protein